jgi:hypothetical protein
MNNPSGCRESGLSGPFSPEARAYTRFFLDIDIRLGYYIIEITGDSTLFKEMKHGVH